MKAKSKVYVHVEHHNIRSFSETDGVVTCHTRKAETIPGLVYTTIPGWFPIAVIRVDADNLNQVLENFEHPVTHKVTLESLAAQFPTFQRQGPLLVNPLRDVNLEVNCGIEGGCREYVS